MVGMILAGISACVSPEELRARDEAACRSYGFQPGTADFASCLQRQIIARRYVGPGWWGPGWIGSGYNPPPPGMSW
jgi:hypothetical protein